MKRLFIYSVLAVLALSSCKKDPVPAEPVVDPGPGPGPGGGGGGGEETIPATADIYILGKKFSSGTGTYALWGESNIREPFADYSLEGSGLEGIFIQENSGAKTVHFFGTKLITQTAGRITYFNKKNYVTLSEKLNIPIVPSWNEDFIAYTTFNKEAYLMAAATLNDLSDKRYYYKIDPAGTPTVHNLLPNKEYKHIAAGSAGVFVSHYEAKLFWTDVSIYRENNLLGVYRVELQDFSFLNTQDMVMINDHTAGFMCSARYDPTGTTEYLYVTIDLITKAVQSHKLGLPAGFHTGTLTVKGGSVLFFGYTDNDKTAYYYQMGNNAGGTFVIQKVPLEANGTSVYTTAGIYENGTNIYVSGSEANKPVYWKDGKIVRLQAGTASTSVILNDIRK